MIDFDKTQATDQTGQNPLPAPAEQKVKSRIIREERRDETGFLNRKRRDSSKREIMRTGKTGQYLFPLGKNLFFPSFQPMLFKEIENFRSSSYQI